MIPGSLSSFSRVAVVSKSFEGQTNKTEEWYGTQYKQEAISEETIEVNHCSPRTLTKSDTILGVYSLSSMSHYLLIIHLFFRNGQMQTSMASSNYL